MGRKSKAVQNDLVELIIDKWEGGKNTIVYVTKDVNKILQDKGLHVTFSRESIRRIIKSHEEEIEDAKKAVEAARAMAEVLKDNPGTEASEAMIMQISSLIAKDIRQIDSLEFENPAELCAAATRLADSQVKLSTYRTKAIRALDRAKEDLKKELKKEVQSDPELLERLIAIVDKAEV